MHHEIPPTIVSGLFSIGAAIVTGLIGLFTGGHAGKVQGRLEGEERFINSVREAAAIVIDGLKEQHEECRTELAAVKATAEEMKAKIDVLMAGAVAPGYELGGRADG